MDQGYGLPLANSPNASEIQDWEVKIKTLRQSGKPFFSPLFDPCYIFGQFCCLSE
jgi:hypothetical protein